MIRTIILSFFTIISTLSLAQKLDKDLEGSWQLFEIIDNMTGDVIKPSHKSNDNHLYYIKFSEGHMHFNLEVNKCSNEYTVEKDRTIAFTYFDTCTEICCDSDFSTLLTYSEANKFYIKENKTLILVSENRIFYFFRLELE